MQQVHAVDVARMILVHVRQLHELLVELAPVGEPALVLVGHGHAAGREYCVQLFIFLLEVPDAVVVGDLVDGAPFLHHIQHMRLHVLRLNLFQFAIELLQGDRKRLLVVRLGIRVLANDHLHVFVGNEHFG